MQTQAGRHRRVAVDNPQRSSRVPVGLQLDAVSVSASSVPPSPVRPGWIDEWSTP
jgi:hypothetical protein